MEYLFAQGSGQARAARAYDRSILAALAFIATLFVLPQAAFAGSISISDISAPSSANVGDSFTITVSVTASDVSGVTGTLTLPSAISCTPTGSQSIAISSGTGSASWSCTGSASGDYTNQITAAVSGTDTGDSSTKSASQQTGLSILAPASLSVSSTISTASVATSASATFTVGVNNAGDVATTFSISLTCPSGVTCSPTSVSSTSIAGKTLTNNAFTATGNNAGTYTLTAAVSSPAQATVSTSKTLTVTGGGTTTTSSTSSGTTPTSGGDGVTAATTTETTTVIAEQTETFATITANTPVDIAITKEEASISKLAITTNTAVSSATVTVKALSARPGAVPTPTTANTPAAPGTATVLIYQYIDVEATNIQANQLSQATFDFKVPKSWLTQNGLTSAEIALARYTTAWETLPTSIVREDAANVYYQATSPGLSTFAVVAIRQATPAPTTPVEAAQPAVVAPLPATTYLILAAVAAGISFVLFFARRKRRARHGIENF